MSRKSRLQFILAHSIIAVNAFFFAVHCFRLGSDLAMFINLGGLLTNVMIVGYHVSMLSNERKRS